jgi:hypothetical protein
MQSILIFIAVLLLVLWIASFIFGLLLHTIGLAIHFAPLIALILIVYVLMTRKSRT